MEIIWGLLFVLGCVFGSFVNMLSYRVAVEYKLKRVGFKVNGQRRSVCDGCGRQLAWFENIPVVSWLFLGGRSRCCHKRLSVLYPLVELGGGLLFLLVLGGENFLAGNPLLLSLKVIILVTLIFCVVFDSKYMILPDAANLVLALCALGVVFLEGHNPLPYLLAGGASGMFLLLLHVVTRGRGMGMGDVKMAVFMGIFLGWQKLLVAYYVAFLVGAVVGVAMVATRRANGKTEIAFGPFLVLGVVSAWVWGEAAVRLASAYF